MERFSGITKKPSTCTHFKKKQIKHNVTKKYHLDYTTKNLQLDVI